MDAGLPRGCRRAALLPRGLRWPVGGSVSSAALQNEESKPRELGAVISVPGLKECIHFPT